MHFHPQKNMFVDNSKSLMFQEVNKKINGKARSMCTLKNQRLKITQLEKARFIKENELKLSQTELF